MWRTVAAVLVAGLTFACASLAVVPPADAAASARPDLLVRSASAKVRADRVSVTLRAANQGRRGAGQSTGEVTLKPAGDEDTTTASKRFALPRLSRGASRWLTVSLAAPAGASGSFDVAVCLDVRSRIRETNGDNNCRSAGTVSLPAGSVSPVTVVSPGPIGAPAPPGAVPAAPAAGGGEAAPADAPADTTPPDTAITQGPAGLTKERAASLWFVSTEAGSTFECRLDDSDWIPCSDPPIVNFVAIEDGYHTFEVRAVDAAGNPDPTPAARSWTVDGTPPQTTITAAPADTVNTRSASAAFASSEAGGSFQCRVDGGPWTWCESPLAISDLAEGAHTLEVRAFDPAGNPDATPAKTTWRIDTAAPETTIASGPSADAVTGPSVQFGLSASESGGSFECRLDGGTWSSCTSPVGLTGLTDGSHTFEARAIDSAGNTDATPASRTWTVDATPAETTIDSGPTGAVNTTSASFTFSSPEAGASFECSIDAGAWAACTSPMDYTALADGSHTFEVRAIDATGNPDTTPASRTWTVDTVAPQTTIDSGPTGTVTTASAQLGFSSSDSGSSFECRIDAGAWAACTSPTSFAALADGSHTFEVRATDPAGNLDATPASQTWTIDTTGPQTTIDSGPTGTVNTASAQLSFSSEAGASFECRLDAGVWAACTSPMDYTALTDGSHTFEVRATDSVGNTDATPDSRTWTVDTTAPQTTIDSGPTGTVTTASAQLSFSSEAGASFECSIDAGAWAACTSPMDYTALADGSHTFEVRATDAAGNVDATPASQTWTVDTAGPQTTIDSGPTGTVTTASAQLSFSSEAGASFECSIDAGAWAACTSPMDYTALADGPHTFEVRATDSVGNTDATPASRSWTVDTTAPETTIDSGPTGPVNTTSADFTFSSSEAGGTFECRLDGGTWAVCTSPTAYAALADGSHTVEVRATDPAGNVDATPASQTWTVDTSVPETTIDVSPADIVGLASAIFQFSSPEAGAGFQCRIDGGAWAVCTSPSVYAALTDGSHTFEVRATDAAGNVDATPASRTWTVDTVAPQTTIDSGPAGAVNTTSAQFGFSSSESGSSFECRIDAGTWEACTSPKSYAALVDGSHSFEVRATDAAGNVDATPDSRTWTVDTTAPQTTIDSGPTGPVNTATAQLDFSSSEPGSSFECRFDAGAWEACTSPKALTALTEGSHTFEVRATDAIGNADATPASRTWTVDTIAPLTAIDSGPTGTVNTTSAQFGFFSSESGSSFECRVDTSAWEPCTSPKSLTGLSDGSHTFEVRATDPAGNTDATAASQSWAIDATPPQTTIDSGPTGAVTSTSAQLGFSSEAGSSFECRIDAGTWEACTSPKSYAALTDGSHTFEVRATDAIGNVDATPDSRTWTVDTTAPETTIDSGPTGTVNTASAQLDFSSSEAGSSFECRIDAGTWEACTSPKSYAALADGSHTFEVRATDALGHVDASPASRTWTVDTTAPETTIDAGPSGTVSTSSAQFEFSSSEAGSSFECRLGAAGAWSPCTSPTAFSALADGDYTFEVRAIDAAGNTDATPDSRTWTVLTAAP